MAPLWLIVDIPLLNFEISLLLLSRPSLARTPCDSDADHALRVDVDDEEREDRAEPDVVGLQEVGGPNGVVA